MSHTPGPWEYFDEMDGHEGTPDLDPAPYEPAQVHPPDREDEPICWLTPHHPRETEANARLIAAAPDLLAALKEMQDMLELWMRDNTGPHELDVLERCEKAIAKAEGR